MLNDGGVTDELAQMEQDWGDWYDDDYVWLPEDAGEHNSRGVVQYSLDDDETLDDDDETVEEAFARIDDEWRNWISD